MADVRNHDLRISGRIKAGNIANGQVKITPVANTPTSVAISGLRLKGAGQVIGLCTTQTSVPGTSVHETSVSSVSSTGMTLWIYRTNTEPTEVGWLMWRKRV
jgi:hypothetical protein